MSTETIPFRIVLDSTHWDRPPTYRILVNDETVRSGAVDGETTVEFVVTLDDDKPHTLSIRLEDKLDKDCVVEDGEIIKDQLIHIKEINVSDIEIGPLKWIGTTYKFDEPIQYNGQTVIESDGSTTLGVNGTYTRPFETPYYFWLLENM